MPRQSALVWYLLTGLRGTASSQISLRQQLPEVCSASIEAWAVSARMMLLGSQRNESRQLYSLQTTNLRAVWRSPSPVDAVENTRLYILMADAVIAVQFVPIAGWELWRLLPQERICCGEGKSILARTPAWHYVAAPSTNMPSHRFRTWSTKPSRDVLDIPSMSDEYPPLPNDR